MEKIIELVPEENELPSEFAGRIANLAASIKPAHIKQKFGQYFTPVAIAAMMSSFVYKNEGLKVVSILDPGAGTAILSCRLIEELISTGLAIQIDLVCYELDDAVIPFTRKSLQYLKSWLGGRKIEFTFELRHSDFIKDHEELFIGDEPDSREFLFDYVISNPPFFKFKKEDTRLKIIESIAYGQPNIYSAFLYAGAKLLKPGGELIFLIPRSFCSGSSFRQFREKLLSSLKLERIHLCGAEEKIFEAGSVLNESVVIHGKRIGKEKESYQINISHSVGRSGKIDFIHSFLFNKYENLVVLPASDADLKILEIVRSWTCSLESLGYKITPGQVMPSASGQYISNTVEELKKYAPVVRVSVNSQPWIEDELFAEENRDYLKICDATLPWLTRNENYVLLRRYSSKQYDSRILTVPYLKKFAGYKLIGIESKFSMIHKITGVMEKSETLGLASILNSRLFDAYLRINFGNINLSPDELIKLPLPGTKIIKEIGNIVSNIRS